MKIINIERNIMHLLGKKWLTTGTSGPFDTDWIFYKVSDIPDKNMKDALDSLHGSGYVELAPKYRSINLTRKGLSKIKVIDLPENGKLPFPQQLE